MHFHPPGNPLAYYDQPFRPTFRRRTRDGLVCYFCGTKPDYETGSPVPCCEAAHDMNQQMRRRAVRQIWDVVARQVRQ